jgi:hypothetical protein
MVVGGKRQGRGLVKPFKSETGKSMVPEPKSVKILQRWVFELDLGLLGDQ